MSAIVEIAAERKRQIESEGWSSSHDDCHSTGEIARAAAAYAYAATLSDIEVQFHHDRLYDRRKGIISLIVQLWPWETTWFKPKDKRRNLIKAGALIVAEIERLDRQSSAKAA